MKIFLGTAGAPLEAKSTEEGISKIRKIGLNSMEVEFVYGVRMASETASHIGRIAKENNVRLSVHAPYYINLCNPEKVEASMKRILDSCERADAMGASVVVFHPGFYGKLTGKEAFEMVKRSCILMEDMIRKESWDVHLGLETTGKVSQFGTLDEIKGVCSKVPLCVPVIDWAHVFARNFGNIDYNRIIDTVSVLDIDILHSHFSGIEFGAKGERKHLPIDSHSPPFSPLAESLKEHGTDINIICESPELEKDALRMKDILHENALNLS